MRKTIFLSSLVLSLLFSACASPVAASRPTSEIIVFDIANSPAPDSGGDNEMPPAPRPTDMVIKEEYVCIQPNGNVIRDRIQPPPGFVRTQADGFGEYIRDQALMPDQSPILLHNGE